MFDSVMIANRAEIASRVIRTVQNMGSKAFAIYSEADATLPYVTQADRAAFIGPPAAVESYLNIDRVIRAARELGADAIHPGYGFLSENSRFAAAVIEAGIGWIGPSPEAIGRLGDKIQARAIASAADVPVLLGTCEPVASPDAAIAAAERIGYPIMVKASAGGGGIGMGVAREPASLAKTFTTAQERARRVFSTTDILLERYVEASRHVEIQLLGLRSGTVVTLGERDCSVQRRHQKVVEETPSPAITSTLRQAMSDAATRVAHAVGYEGAGTVEFLLDTVSGEFYFLEMNTRLQVEHAITEMVTGLDLVRAQLDIAAGDTLDVEPTRAVASGHAIEFRIYAEDPIRFFPSPGLITSWRIPTGSDIRVDAGYSVGNVVTPYYDPLLAKLCCRGDTRPEALQVAREALASFQIEGPQTNIAFLSEVLANERFAEGAYDTSLIVEMRGR